MSKEINVNEVVKKYLLSELSKIFSGDEFQIELERGIDSLSEKALWRLLEALSFNFRLNGMFWCLSNNGFVWREEEVDCAQLTLTRMNPDIDAVTHSESIQNSPIAFRNYLISYFENHPDDDPEHLGQFRPSGKSIQYPFIFLLEEEGKLKLLDGSNRLIAHISKGENKIRAFIGKKIREENSRIGDSVFWLLRRLYERTEDKEEKSSILSVVKMLIKSSSDGFDAVQNYWIKHAKTEEVKKVGQKLISE